MATRRAIICIKIRDDTPDYIAIFSILAAPPLRQELLDECRNGATVSATCQLLAGNAHHLAHVLGARCTHLSNNGFHLSFEFLRREGLREILFNHLGLCLLFLSEVGAVLLVIESGRVAALLSELGEDFEGDSIIERVVGSRSVLASMKNFLMLRNASRRTLSLAFMAATISLLT